jgi:hypothetical protein
MILDSLPICSRFFLRNAINGTSNESGEQYGLINKLDGMLVKSGIVHNILETFSIPGGVQGRIDFALMKDSTRMSILCEAKSTQNLTLPTTAALCVEKYTSAYNWLKKYEEWTTELANIAHPIGQLLGYMVDNTCRFGALTSGTRTYFIYISDDDVNASDDNEYIGKKVMITDAWFVGQHNYLRAWAYVHNLGCNATENDKWDPPEDWWIKSTTGVGSPKLWSDKKAEIPGEDGECDKPSFTKKSRFNGPDNTEDGNNGTTTSSTSMNYSHEFSQELEQQLPYVSIDKIKIMDTIGYGRNGDCFRVNWNGQLYAMKQYDIVRDGDLYFKKELLAYRKLKAAWGVLVPKPMFLSESVSGGRWFLGLQLGHKPTVVNDDTMKQFNNVLNRLEKEYGIRHNDAEGRNMLYITDADGVERIVAIDFEDWESCC